MDLPEYGAVLDGLLAIRDEQDGSLSMRCSCRSAICGSCAMKINGKSRLACKTMVSQLKELEGDVISVEPMGNQPVIKDLVVNMDMFWDKVNAVQPYLRPEGPPPEKEYLVSNESMMELAVAMNCIMCGACVSDCTVLEVDKGFLGPAALAKAFRFAGDPRDGHKQERLQLYTEPERRVGLHAVLHVCFGVPEGCCTDGAHHGRSRDGNGGRADEYPRGAARGRIRIKREAQRASE